MKFNKLSFIHHYMFWGYTILSYFKEAISSR